MTGDGKGYQQARARPSSHNIFRSLTEVNPRTNRTSPPTMGSKKEKERKTILNRFLNLQFCRMMVGYLGVMMRMCEDTRNLAQTWKV